MVEYLRAAYSCLKFNQLPLAAAGGLSVSQPPDEEEEEEATELAEEGRGAIEIFSRKPPLM